MDQKMLNIFWQFPYNKIQKLVILFRGDVLKNTGSRIQ